MMGFTPSSNESLPRRYWNRVLAPEGELLSFASPKESNQRKGDPVAACFLCSSLLPRVSRRGSCPSADVRHPCRTPDGLCSTKAPVLGAAYGGKPSVRNISYRDSHPPLPMKHPDHRLSSPKPIRRFSALNLSGISFLCD
jgi:hypothetical protein